MYYKRRRIPRPRAHLLLEESDRLEQDAEVAHRHHRVRCRLCGWCHLVPDQAIYPRRLADAHAQCHRAEHQPDRDAQLDADRGSEH